MSKKVKRKNLEEENAIAQIRAIDFYRTKYYGIFLQNFRFPELTEQENHFVLKRLWLDGRIAGFILKESKLPDYMKDVEGEEQLKPIFTPFAPFTFNIYDYPIKVELINRRAVNFIPQEPQEVNKDCVIGYAHKTHCSVSAMVDYYIRKIVDVENAIDICLFNLKLPRLVAIEPENKERVKFLIDKVINGEKVLFCDVDDVNRIKDILQGNPTTADNLAKLFNYKQALENELLTWMGVDNKGTEKRERQIVDEVNANNEIINDSNGTFLDSMKEFCENFTNVLGFKLSIITTSNPVTATGEEIDEEEDDEYEME